MQQFGKRLLALLLVICAVVGFLPATAFPAAAATETEIVGQQLSLGDDLTMRFYASVGEEYVSNAVMNVAACGVSTDYAIKDETPNSDGNYVFSVDLSAAEMTEDITLTLTSGQIQLLQKVYSVQDYAHYLLEENYTTETKNLVREMLNYGAKAQQYFDHKTDDLANAGYVLDETERTISDAAPSVVPSGSVSGVTLYGCTMVFEYKIAIRCYFKAPNGMADCTVTVDGEPVEVRQKGSYYYIEVDDINPDKMDTLLNIKVTRNAEELSFQYSPMYYITRMYHNTENAGLKSLVLAAKYYFDAAEVFTGVKEAHTGDLTLGYRYGTNSLIQVNTNLASDIPCVNFTAGDNGCNIDQSANLYQQVAWIGMEQVSGTTVLTFHFNAAFEAGQTYFLPKGAVFGFTDGSRYTLDKNYTFTFDGSGWSMEAKEDPITLSYRYGTNSLIQFNTNLPISETNGDFTAAENGCTFNENGDTRVGWVGTANVDGTVVLTFHLSAAAATGQSYNLGKDSVFVLDDGSKYQLEQDITLYWDGAKWIETVPALPELSFQCRWGNSNTLQINTNLPASTPLANFTTGQNGCSIDESGNTVQWVGWIGMDNADGTIVLTFHFNNAFTAGQTYVLPKGAVFGFTDGSRYTLDKHYTFTFDGSGWSMEAKEDPVTLAYRWGNSNTIQFNTDLPATTPLQDFLAADNGCQLTQGGDQQVGYVSMLNADGTIVLTFNFNNAFTFGQKYTLSAGSVFGFTDGSKYSLTETVTLYFNGEGWVTEEPTDVLEESNFEGGKDIITFADMPVDGNDATKLQEYVELGFNTSLLAEDHTGALGPDELYKVDTNDMTHLLGTLTFQYRYGAANVLQVNTNLPVTTPVANFTAGVNGCIIDQSGNQYQQVGWIQMHDPSETGGIMVLTFHFNNNFEAGQTYVLPAGAIFGFTDGNTYTLDGDYTFTFDGSNWSMDCVRPLTLSLNAANQSYIQLKTNIPTGLTYGDFLLGDSSRGHNVILETTEGAKSVAWFSYSELSGAVYLTLNFGEYNKPGTQYILKAGTTLKAGDNYYTLQQDYVMTYRNIYLESLEKLDAAGLNVWIRNYHNTADYFSESMTKALKLYQDVIDGFYMADEAFQTQALQSASGQTATTNFEAMATLRDWFNANFATKYFHANHVPITSYDHYNSTTGSTLNDWDTASYKNFLAGYESGILDALTTPSGASIGFDSYPFIHAQGGHGGFWGIGSTWESGIQKTFLVSALTAAQVAKETGRDFSMCIQTFEAIDQEYKNTSRDIERASEVALQLYTGMAMGVDIFEYFAYNSSDDFNGIMNTDGSKRIYDIVKEGNQALCFQDVVNTFTWDGIMTCAGTNNNQVGFGYVSGMVLGDSNNGVLSSVTSAHDAIIGCFTKDALNGYMVVNFEDPAAVTGNNTVTLTFDGCSRARVYTQTGGVLSSQVVNLTNGTYTATLAPGSACFVIPA